MRIDEIVDREDPVGEYADSKEHTGGDTSMAKGAFRKMLHRYKKMTKKDTLNMVTSSWILALDYNHRNKVCTMRLKCGRNYDIQGMEPNVYYNWVKAPSKGKFFHQHVKGEYYI